MVKWRCDAADFMVVVICRFKKSGMIMVRAMMVMVIKQKGSQVLSSVSILSNFMLTFNSIQIYSMHEYKGLNNQQLDFFCMTWSYGGMRASSFLFVNFFLYLTTKFIQKIFSPPSLVPNTWSFSYSSVGEHSSTQTTQRLVIILGKNQ